MEEDQGVWLTYAELAKLRGIDKASAAKLVLRRKWRRQKDNQGTVRILVPPEWADSSREPSPDPSRDPSLDTSADTPQTINALEREAAALRETVNRERGRADRAEADATRLATELRETQVTATAAQVQAAELAGEARGLREALEEARKPFWRRWLGT